jgi:hypothetical protein
MAPPNAPSHPSSHYHRQDHHQQHRHHNRPKFKETDYCPICHSALPYLPDPSEAGREAHIALCISEATSMSSPSIQQTYGNSPSGGSLSSTTSTPSTRTHPNINTTPTSISRARSYTNGGRMVVWNACERDCKDPSTDETIECVICFEDFEEKQEIARLECLCRYHKVCIPPSLFWARCFVNI